MIGHRFKLVYASFFKAMQYIHSRFKNRIEAGQLLADRLKSYSGSKDLLILGLPRGGVPVAWEVAKRLNALFDVILVRKLGVPQNKELAMGAIAPGGIRILNNEIIRALGISQETINEVASEESQELERREKLFRNKRPQPLVRGKTVIIIDDGIATGSTMRAVIAILKSHRPAELIVAVPVAPASTLNEISSLVDRVVCLIVPEEFYAIGPWYEDFSQTTEDEVCAILSQANASSKQNPIDKPEG